MAAGVQLSQVGKEFGSRTVLEDVDLTIAPSEFLSLVGSSGCGKTTLLRLICGLERPTSGQITRTQGVQMGYVFQEAHLLPWRTVARNVSLPLELKGVPASERQPRVEEALRRVGMEKDPNLFPSQLSGGMKMRVSLARALVTNPTLLLLDEPFAALDELTRVHLEEQLRLLWEQTQMTIVLVTHSFSEAVFLSDRIVMLSAIQHGVSDSLDIALPKNRTAQLRTDTAFTQQVDECRRRCEAIQKGQQ